MCNELCSNGCDICNEQLCEECLLHCKSCSADICENCIAIDNNCLPCSKELDGASGSLNDTYEYY